MSDHLKDWLCRAGEAKRLALIAHTAPDGDTVGAVLALRLAFLSKGKAVDIICDGDVPQEMRWLPGAEAFRLVPAELDAVVVRLRALADILRAHKHARKHDRAQREKQHKQQYGYHIA